jgi:mannose-6-phosphate isomerase
MRNIHVLTNSIQTYEWGSHTAIAKLLGFPAPSEEPQAELWMGAHPKAPSRVKINDEHQPLIDLIEKHPIDILGQHSATLYGNQLPYLFKVLASEMPLSIQAHPNTDQAISGYARENDLGILINAPHRNYKDDHHKPECLCALTPFWGLCGFRKISQILYLLQRACPQTLRRALHHLKTQPDSTGLKIFFQSIMTMEKEKALSVIQEAVTQADSRKGEDDAFDWIIKLAAVYPGDIGVIFPAVLNLVCLRPGEAMYLSSGELHAYLHGVGMEIMANSDNVLRGGLTPKHVDVPELMNVLTFQERTIDVLQPEADRPHEKLYRTPAEEFILSAITLKQGDTYESLTERSVEIMLVTEGRVEILDEGNGKRSEMTSGVSVIVPAAVPRYIIKGEGVVYKAAVPLQARS